MKIAFVVVRTLMGLLFIFASVAVLFHLVQEPEQTGNVKLFMDGIKATGYFMMLLKLTELVCGLAFVSGYFVPLASIVISPIIINIFLFHLFLDSSGLPVAIFLIFANSFVAYSNWDKYRPVLQPK